VWALIREQVRYIAERSVVNALAWESRLDAAIFGLADMPTYAVDEDASDRLGHAVRKLVFEGTYLVHYWLDEPAGIINVIGFRHGAREPQPGEP
jgi:plasmid stabilization system protein ParE